MYHFAVSAKPCLPSLGIIFIETLQCCHVPKVESIGQSQAPGSSFFSQVVHTQRLLSPVPLLRPGAREIMLPPSAIRNPGLERAPGTVGRNHRMTVETLGVSGHLPNPTRLPNPPPRAAR